MRKADQAGSVIVPIHNRDLRRGTLGAILEDAGLSEERFLELLRS